MYFFFIFVLFSTKKKIYSLKNIKKQILKILPEMKTHRTESLKLPVLNADS